MSGNNVECQAAFANICKEAGIELGEGSSASDILNFVKSTQDKFVNRKNGKERWESTDLIWINEKNPQKILKTQKTAATIIESVLFINTPVYKMLT